MSKYIQINNNIALPSNSEEEDEVDNLASRSLKTILNYGEKFDDDEDGKAEGLTKQGFSVKFIRPQEVYKQRVNVMT